MCGARATPSDRSASSAARRVTSASSGCVGRRVRREAALHQVPQPLAALARSDADGATHPHELEHARDVALLVPAGGQPRRDRAVLELAHRQRAVGAQAVDDVRAEVGVEVPPLLHPPVPGAVAARPGGHLPAVQREILGEHERRLVRPVLEQLAVVVRELLQQADVERAEAAEQHEQVRAGDGARGIELQAAQRTADVEDLLAARTAPRRRAVEALRGHGEPPRGGDGDFQHPPNDNQRHGA